MGKYLLHDTVITQSKKIVTDSINANAELQARTVLKPKIERRSSAGSMIIMIILPRII